MWWWWRLCLLLLLLLLLLQSHNAAFERERVQTMADGWRSQWVESPWTTSLASWPADVPVHRLEGQAGQCIIFSEKLKHGTIPWSSETQERRTLFYKCEPRNFATVWLDPVLTLGLAQTRRMVCTTAMQGMMYTTRSSLRGSVLS